MSDKKPRKSLLNDVFKYTDKGREEFVKKIDDEVIDAFEAFQAKKKHDEWWRKALRRLNKINGHKKEDE